MTNAPKHTPGPWTVEPRQWDHGVSLAIVAPNNGYVVSIIPFDEDIQTVDDPDYDTVKRHPDEEPNAHLIATAPAMYAESKTLCSLVRAFMNDNRLYDGQLIQAIHNLETALAQAEGRG